MLNEAHLKWLTEGRPCAVIHFLFISTAPLSIFSIALLDATFPKTFVVDTTLEAVRDLFCSERCEGTIKELETKHETLAEKLNKLQQDYQQTMIKAGILR